MAREDRGLEVWEMEGTEREVRAGKMEAREGLVGGQGDWEED